jgi:hypothetical protein
MQAVTVVQLGRFGKRTCFGQIRIAVVVARSGLHLSSSLIACASMSQSCWRGPQGRAL